MTVGVVILAAGSGTRARTTLPKQFMPLAGIPVLRRTIDAFLRIASISHVQVVIALTDEDHYQAATKGLNLPKPVYGGNTRQKSVMNGLEALSNTGADIKTVLIHDGARPFVSQNIIEGVISKVQTTGDGAIPALPVSDTIKRANDGIIETTVDRNALWQAQTPQGFVLKDIIHAHRQQAEQNLTDDAAIAEASGIKVHISSGSVDNIKLTHPDDFKRAEQMLGNVANEETRTGFGMDVHKLEENQEKQGVVLCGITLPHDKSLSGHSDADVAMHALTDALLGAIAMGDIGDHFPPTDKKWRGASSDIFLKHAKKLVAEKNGRIVNVDITIVCEAPKIAPYRGQMRDKLSEILSLDVERISVKATTSEKLGFMGRGEGILAEATATVAIRDN